MTIKNDKYTFEQSKSKLKHDGKKLPFYRKKIKKHSKIKLIFLHYITFEGLNTISTLPI